MSDSRRWVRILVPEPFERSFLGPDPVVMDEAPKGVGREVRLATEQEVGLFACPALPLPRC
jgi:hypothetical protein